MIEALEKLGPKQSKPMMDADVEELRNGKCEEEKRNVLGYICKNFL